MNQLVTVSTRITQTSVTLIDHVIATDKHINCTVMNTSRIHHSIVKVMLENEVVEEEEHKYAKNVITENIVLLSFKNG